MVVRIWFIICIFSILKKFEFEFWFFWLKFELQNIWSNLKCWTIRSTQYINWYNLVNWTRTHHQAKWFLGGDGLLTHGRVASLARTYSSAGIKILRHLKSLSTWMIENICDPSHQDLPVASKNILGSTFDKLQNDTFF